MLASFAIGSHVLSFFGISLPVVQVGGGMIVVSAGWALLKQKDQNDRNAVGRTVSGTDVLRDAFYPLTLPLTVGPGSISVAITLGANEPHSLGASVLSILAARIGSAIVAATIYLCYAFADRLATVRSEEHTSELQSQSNLVCRLLLEKKNTRTSRRDALTTSCRRSQSGARARPPVISDHRLLRPVATCSHRTDVLPSHRCSCIRLALV